MRQIKITSIWRFPSPLHVGTGLSQAGVGDRTIRLDKGVPVIPGDAAKGATRMAAERLLRWLAPGTEAEAGEHSVPRHALLRRLFAPAPNGVFYRFSMPRHLGGGEAVSIASTKIEAETGVAANQTLRLLQSWSSGARFEATVRGFGGEWENREGGDYWDAVFLYAAAAATDALGGKRSVGHGELVLEALECSVEMPDLSDAGTVEKLRAHLAEGEGNRG